MLGHQPVDWSANPSYVSIAPVPVVQQLSLAPWKQTYSAGPIDAAERWFSACRLQIYLASRKFRSSKWGYCGFNDDEGAPRGGAAQTAALFERVKQRLCSFQIGRLKTFGEAIIDWLQQRLRVRGAALIP
jgi:hypothetical protein